MLIDFVALHTGKHTANPGLQSHYLSYSWEKALRILLRILETVTGKECLIFMGMWTQNAIFYKEKKILEGKWEKSFFAD